MSALFSSTIFSTCFIRDSSASSSSDAMDAFLRRIQQKTPRNTTHFPPGSVTCVYGRSGIGKTYMVDHELPDHVHVDHAVLKSKQMTIDFFERLKYTDAAVIIDDWEGLADLIGVREITGPVSQGPLVIIAQTAVKLTPDTILYELPVMTPDQIEKLAPTHPKAKDLAVSCRGDVRFFLRSLTHASDAPDAFKTSREIVTDLVMCPKPSKYLETTLHEHGYVWNMVQENYVDTKGITIETCAEITESMSIADMYDTKIYADGVWETLMPYFVLTGCVTPCHLMNQKLNPVRMRAGAMWTKFQNVCMRRKKIHETGLSHDELQTVRAYVEHGDYRLLDEYKLDAASIDVMNHIVIGQKLKPKAVEQAKKHVRARDS